MSTYHIPVMLKEVISYLEIKPGHWYVDCNLGGGGHTEGILKSGGKVLGIDLDPNSILEVAKNHNLNILKTDNQLQAVSSNLILIQSNFVNLKEITQKFPLGHISGILFDLGISSHQLEQTEGGFSFGKEAPLDMRMDPNLQVTAADLVNGLHEKELVELFTKYGEESWAKPIAKKIVEVRQKDRITLTSQLSQIITSVKRQSRGEKIHPATQVFQALRIAVNDELGSLQTSLPQALNVLKPGGRMAVISFHSLEDRIAKNFFQNEYKNGTITIITQKPITPHDLEIEDNPRSRSAKLRVAEKL